jgi:hypothetical protein
MKFHCRGARIEDLNSVRSSVDSSTYKSNNGGINAMNIDYEQP